MKIHPWVRSTFVLIMALTLPLTASGERPLTTAGASSIPLTFVEAIFDAGLQGASSMALSPDDQYLYVASNQDDAVTVFRRDDASGRLAFVEVIWDGTGGASELDGARGIAVTPDGGHVYVVSREDDALTVFSRDTATGRLTFVEAHKEGVGGIVSLDGARSVAISPDSKHVYVASEVDEVISVFSRNAVTGALTFLEAESVGLDTPLALAISPDGQHIYAANYGNDSISVFGRWPTSGLLDYHSAVQDNAGGVDGLAGAVHVCVSPDGDNVYVAAIGENAVAAFQRRSTDGALTFVEAHKDGGGGVDGLDGAIAVAVSLDGTHVYVAGSYEAAVAIFARSPAGGALSYARTTWNGSDGVHLMMWPAAITLDQESTHLYVAAQSGGAVEVFDRSASSGALTIKEEVSGDGLQGAVGVAVGSDGCVYATGHKDNKVAFFGQNPATGALTYLGNISAEVLPSLEGPIGVAVSPDGQHVYVAGYTADAVVAFQREPGCAGLGYVATYTNGEDGVEGLDGPRSIAFSPDGSLLYVASDQDDAVAIFYRNQSSGVLSFWQALYDGQGSIDGLDGAYAVAVSPDGFSFYVAGYYEDAVAVFGYPVSGLSFVGVVRDGVGGVDGLYGANSVAVSPDGHHVYVASRLDDAVAIFSRSLETGMLTYLSMVKDGVGAVDGLNGARALSISPDGSQVYVASQFDDALAVFAREASDGSLALVAVHKDGAGGVNGLNTADGIAVSPGGAHVYVAGYDDDAIVVFGRFRAYLPMVIR